MRESKHGCRDPLEGGGERDGGGGLRRLDWEVDKDLNTVCYRSLNSTTRYSNQITLHDDRIFCM